MTEHPRKRTDPKQNERNRALIRQQIEGVERNNRALRSQQKAKSDAEDYKTTGEGTMGEAWQNLLDEAAQKRYVKKYGGPPEVEGAAQVGFKKNNSPI